MTHVKFRCKSLCKCPSWGLESSHGLWLLSQFQPSDYELKSKKKGALRFWTPFIKEQLDRLAAAEQELSDAQRDQVRSLLRASCMLDLRRMRIPSVSGKVVLLGSFQRPREFGKEASSILMLLMTCSCAASTARCEVCSPSLTNTESYGQVLCGAWRTWMPCCR